MWQHQRFNQKMVKKNNQILNEFNNLNEGFLFIKELNFKIDSMIKRLETAVYQVNSLKSSLDSFTWKVNESHDSILKTNEFINDLKNQLYSMPQLFSELTQVLNNAEANNVNELTNICALKDNIINLQNALNEIKKFTDDPKISNLFNELNDMEKSLDSL